MEPSRNNQRTDEDGSFRRLVDEHQAAIRAFAAARMSDPFEAYDIAQEVFLVAFRKVDEIDPGRSPRSWLYEIAANLIRNHRRKRRAVAASSVSENILELFNVEIDARSHRMQDESLLEALDACLAKLGSKTRELIRMRYEEGMGIAEIRASQGGGHSAMTMKLHRLREQLRICIESRTGVDHG